MKGDFYMKYTVIRPFVDKNTKQRYRTGDTFECDGQRFNEISKAGKFLTPQHEQADENDAAVASAFESMTDDELRQYADAKHKLTFGEEVGRVEMIAVLAERESEKG